MVKLQPESPGIYSKLGDAIEQKYHFNIDAAIQDYHQAIQHRGQYLIYDKLLEFLEDNPNLFVEMANNLAKADKNNGAIIFYKMALEINQDDLDICHKLQQVLDKNTSYPKKF